jgi:diguanylate cyclase (GGDEF)-like protein
MASARPHRARRLDRRERRVESVAAAAFLVVAAAMPLALGSGRAFAPAIAGALVAVHAIASRVRLYVGAGYVMPTQLVLIPMLFLLPAASVPLVVAAGLVAAAGVDVIRGRAHPERVVTGIADAWHAIGSSLVIVLAGEPGAGAVAWPVVALALLAQSGVDVLTATAREWFGRRIRPTLHAGSLAMAPLIDAFLTPVAILAASAAAARPTSVVAVVPLLGLLAALSADRRHRIEDAARRLEALRAEEARLDRAISRIGQTFASKLNSTALVELALRTAAEACRADRGRAVIGERVIQIGRSDKRLDRALAAAREAVEAQGHGCAASCGDAFALGHPLPDGTVLTVARAREPFSEDDQRRFGSLVRQVGVALENAALHEQLRQQATTDELTGLANHRRFEERLRHEVRRSRRSGRPVSLVMLDIDDFKRVNDTYGHQQGDRVLREVATAVRRACRSTDLPARYGGEELAVILPDTDLDGASVAAEAIRRAVDALELPLADGGRLGVTVSAGVGAVTAGGDAGSLIAAADAALYDAKRAGKNRVVRAGRGRGRFNQRDPEVGRAAAPAVPRAS